MPQILWTAFPEDVLSAQAFDEAQQQALIRIFDLGEETSPFRRALALLDVPAPAAAGDMVMFYQNRPYINATVLTALVSGGAVRVVPDSAAGYRFKTSFSPFAYARLFRLQWKLSLYMQAVLAQADIPSDDDAALAESLALGLCLQGLMMRLGTRGREHLAVWLADPAAAPATQRTTVTQLQAVQARRTRLSPVWHRRFALRSGAAVEVPSWFWDHPRAVAAETPPASPAAAQMLFEGMPVCGGRVSGMAVVMAGDHPPRKKPADKCVFVFRHARPQAVAAYAMADAVLFANGGLLSHACVVAREQGLPCITGLGNAFYERLQEAGGRIWLAVDGAHATVRVIQDEQPALDVLSSLR